MTVSNLGFDGISAGQGRSAAVVAVTMADVAARAGVSVSTVSHVLNHTRPVSSDRQSRVWEAVDALRYSPNVMARSLATSSTRLIGIVMGATSNPFFAPVFSAMEGVATRKGYTMLLADSHDELDREEAQARIMLDHQVAGLILAPASSRTDPVLSLLADRELPVVLVDRMADDRFDQVGVENVNATAQLVTHLAGHGHQRIAFIGGRTKLATTPERLAGYRLGLEQSGLRPDRRLIRSGGSETLRAAEATRQLLRLPDPPTAVVSANNAMTLGVLRTLRERGVSVPGDMAVVAFDDVAWGDLVSPGLTAMAQPVEAIGRTAAQLLLDRMADPSIPPRRRELAPTFVQRESCGCTPSDAVGDSRPGRAGRRG